MTTPAKPNANFDALRTELAEMVAGARTLDEIGAWLRSRPGVGSATLANYLLKSNPPQRIFTIQVRADDGEFIQKDIVIFALGAHRFKFNKIIDK